MKLVFNTLLGVTFHFNDLEWAKHSSRFYRVRVQ